MDPENVITSEAATTDHSESNGARDDGYDRVAIYKAVRLYGDPVLRTRAHEVEQFDEALRESINYMRDLAKDAPAYGLAANQVGALQRVFIYHMEMEDPFTAVVNPVIDWSSEETDIVGESCFSIPEVVIEVERPVSIRLRAQDEFGNETVRDFDGIEARVIQHELDHLDGILILDRTTTEQRRDGIRAVHEWIAESEATN